MNLQNKGKRYEFDLASGKVFWEVGKLAHLSAASIFAGWGDTRILVTVDVGQPDPNVDFFPMTVEYLEKMYAAGSISSSKFIKRERFPSLEAILNGRIIDRALRPRFPKGFNAPVLITIVVLSYQTEFDPAILAMNTASMALTLAGLPFDGPIAGLRFSIDDNKKPFLDSHSVSQKDDTADLSPMNMVLGLDEKGVIMFDAEFTNQPKELVKETMDFAMEAAKPVFEAQKAFAKELTIEKREFTTLEAPEEIITFLKKKYTKELTAAVKFSEKPSRLQALAELKEKIKAEKELDQDDIWTSSNVEMALDTTMKYITRDVILETKMHIDGRQHDQVRELSMELDLLPRSHGSALFKRGDTAALSIVTLGAPDKQQLVESMNGEESQRYMHHYVAPPYCYGEVGRIAYMPGRRELGHGALAEKALEPVLPSFEAFPYTIRVVSEIVSSAGSTSMASTCGSSLSLMAAGVPIKEHVAGISVGLVSKDEFAQYQLLTDIIDIEDFYGDMDFKVTGTRDGITAIQMDNKQKSVPVAILKEAIDAATDARMMILDKMYAVIDKPRAEMSPYAPRIDFMHIDPDLIGKVIGPGGKTIKEITAKSEASINIDDDGKVAISAVTQEARDAAKKMIDEVLSETDEGRGMGRGGRGGHDRRPPTPKLDVNEMYDVTVNEVMPFGFVVGVDGHEGVTGLIHISEAADGFVKDLSTIGKVGDHFKAKLIDQTPDGKLRFSLKSK